MAELKWPAAETAPYHIFDDDLRHSDGEPMETYQHVLQMKLLMDPLMFYWRDRNDVFVGGNMFVYFSPDQEYTHHFKGPDVFVVTGVAPRPDRKSWVVWQDGKPPDVVIELLSPSISRVDRGPKKQIYQDELRVPIYILFDVLRGKTNGFVLQSGTYRTLIPDSEGRFSCDVIGLLLTPWFGAYQKEERHWLRWTLPDGSLLPTPEEAVAAAEQKLERAQEMLRRMEDAQRSAQRARENAAQTEAKLRAAGAEPEEFN